MRISRKIGLSFFITFLLVIFLGLLSIYSLRHIYKGMDQVFSKDLPASRFAYQTSISIEDLLSELNNFLITMNENFKADYERSYKDIEGDMARFNSFITKDEEKALFENAKGLSKDINDTAGNIFKDSAELKILLKAVRKMETEYKEGLDNLFDFEEERMMSEKDLLLINAQHIPAALLIRQARLKFSNSIDSLLQYTLSKKGDQVLSLIEDLETLDKYIKDYKNYHGYALSDTERSIASNLIDLSGKIKEAMDSISSLKDSMAAESDSLFIKEKDIMDTLAKLISVKKSRISSKLGIGATLTEDIPAIHNISKIEMDILESWRLSSRYIMTGNEAYKHSYYQLRQVIDKQFKDYEVHARLRGTDKILEDIIEKDRGIVDGINSNMGIFEEREKGYAELISIRAGLEKKIDELLSHNDAAIKEAQDSEKVLNKLVPARWALTKLEVELSDSQRLLLTYLNDQESAYKDMYAQLYFNMKKHINTYRNVVVSDSNLALINEIESGLDKFNTAMLGVISDHDNIIKEMGWTLVKLEDSLKDDLKKALDNEIKQIEKNKSDIRNRIAAINIVISLIILAVAFIAIFIVFYTTRSITNPIQELYNGAELIGKGNLDHRLNIKTGDEIEELAEGFNRMAGELKELYTNLENKVKERTAQLGEANEALGRTNKELDDFTYIVSHDLKEPLRGVKAFTKLLVEEYGSKLNDEAMQYLKTISESSTRMTRLIEDLLNLSRIGRIKNIEPDIEINEVLSDVKKNLVYALEERNVELTIKPDFPKVTCDRIRIMEVFSNLISNAIKYTKKEIRPVIEIGWSDKKDFYEFYVKDNGIGIEKQYYEKIFQIFQRLHAKDEYEGTGAGLTIVKKIVESHGGRLWVDSQVGVGSTFYFTLPKIAQPIRDKDKETHA
jgi:signal transduction histidine kinase/CHASE3 domain sensor protein